MPEGDTIHRTAATLTRALVGSELSAARSSVPGLDAGRLAGRRVERVEARGKNLLVHVEGDLVLHSHLRMHGAWHVYRPGEPWRKPARQARLVLETAAWTAVCFLAPVLRLLTASEIARDPSLARLGPDLLDPRFDREEARRRIRALDDVEVGVAIMAQSAVAGVGNVYKSETLFLCGVDPFRRVRDLTDREIDRMLRTARDLMRRNLDGYPRVTRSGARGARHWVYGRSGRPCARCGSRVRMRRQGETGRSTYWCPRCQGGDRGDRPGGGRKKSPGSRSDYPS